jgi:hypothetical protein
MLENGRIPKEFQSASGSIKVMRVKPVFGSRWTWRESALVTERSPSYRASIVRLPPFRLGSTVPDSGH